MTNYYRNIHPIPSPDFPELELEPGTLFILTPLGYRLVDDDQYIIIPTTSTHLFHPDPLMD
jgi:hypothetical protein